MPRSPSLTRRISLTIATMAFSVGVTNYLSAFFLQSQGWLGAFSDPNVWSMPIFGAWFILSRYLPEKSVQITQAVLILLLSGPTVLTSTFSFFGMWFFLLGTILLYKYHLLQKQPILIGTLLCLYFLPWLFASAWVHDASPGYPARIVDDAIFLVSCVVFLYFIFEAEIRMLLSSNRQQERALADQAVEIARMEPLSVIGERVSHVAQSFQNNLAQFQAIAATLHHANDAREGAVLLNEANQTLAERIEAILMISRSGHDLEAEDFDVVKVLEGIKFVYLTEPVFHNNIWSETTFQGPLIIRAVRWDFILMVENILKNACDAINARGIRGIVRIHLAGGLLTIANNGGPMELCKACIGSCSECPLYGHDGRGLAQVFSTCRKNGWMLRIRTDNEWTNYQILLTTGV